MRDAILDLDRSEYPRLRSNVYAPAQPHPVWDAWPGRLFRAVAAQCSPQYQVIVWAEMLLEVVSGQHP